MEVWKNIVGFEENYEISNFGNIKSKTIYVNTKANGTRIKNGKTIKIN